MSDVLRPGGREPPLSPRAHQPACRRVLDFGSRSAPERSSVDLAGPSSNSLPAGARSRIKKLEREAPIIEAQRKQAHAEFMAKWRASMAERKKQIAENRRRLEASSRKPAVHSEQASPS
jgi:hypothetical protein